MVGSLIVQFGYFAVLIGVLLESAGIPVPGETILIVAGVAASRGHFNLEAVIALGVAGAVTGDQIGYWIGRTKGRDFLLRHGRVFRVTAKRIDRVDAFFAKHGGKAVFLARFVAGLRVFGAFAAGVSRMRWRTFFIFNVLGALTWASGAVMVGYILGDSYDLAEHWIGRASALLAIVAGLIAILYAGHRLALSRRWYARVDLAGRVGRNRFWQQVAPRFTPHTAYGLSLTAGIISVTFFTWIFGVIAQDVSAGDPLVRLDHSLLRAVHSHADHELTTTVDLLTKAFAPEFVLLIAATAGAALIARRRRQRHGHALGILLMTNAIGCGVLIEVFKTLIHRARPPAALQTGVPRIDGYGFPSGHALVAASIGMVAWYALVTYGVRALNSGRGKARFGFAIGITVLLAGLGRIYTGAHYPTDVIAGWSLGVAWASICIVCTSVLLTREQPTETEPRANDDAPAPPRVDA